MLKKLILKLDQDLYHLSDINRIVEVCKQNGYVISKTLAQFAWEQFSKDFYQSDWLELPVNDDDLLSLLSEHVEEKEDKFAIKLDPNNRTKEEPCVLLKPDEIKRLLSDDCFIDLKWKADIIEKMMDMGWSHVFINGHQAMLRASFS